MLYPPDLDLDARDLLCPLPVLRARKALMTLPAGAILRVLATDPAARLDMPHFAQGSAHVFLGHEEVDGACAFYFRSAGPEADRE